MVPCTLALLDLIGRQEPVRRATLVTKSQLSGLPQTHHEDAADSAIVFLVEDDNSVRRSLQRLLELAGYKVEEFSMPEGLLARLPYEGHGCVVTDLKLPNISGLALQKMLKQSGCLLPLVFITGWGQVAHAVAAVKEGAVDFLEKPVDPQALTTAVRQAVEKSRTLRANEAAHKTARRLLARLTSREYQVCELAARGLLNKQIAAELGTSEKTVKAQRGSAARKLNVQSTAMLVDVLRKAGPGSSDGVG